jgi:hypothetical protein
MESSSGASRKVPPEIVVATDERTGPALTRHIDEELRRLGDAAGWSRACRDSFCADFAEAE